MMLVVLGTIRPSDATPPHSIVVTCTAAAYLGESLGWIFFSLRVFEKQSYPAERRGKIKPARADGLFIV
jgi:hypothetical protein